MYVFSSGTPSDMSSAEREAKGNGKFTFGVPSQMIPMIPMDVAVEQHNWWVVQTSCWHRKKDGQLGRTLVLLASRRMSLQMTSSISAAKALLRGLRAAPHLIPTSA